MKTATFTRLDRLTWERDALHRELTEEKWTLACMVAAGVPVHTEESQARLVQELATRYEVAVSRVHKQRDYEIRNEKSHRETFTKRHGAETR